MKKIIFITILLVSTECFAQGLPPVGIKDEGGAESKPVFTLNCVGDGISCSHSGTTGTISASGATTPNIWSTFLTSNGSTSANTASDILTVVGQTGLVASISGDTLTIGGDETSLEGFLDLQDLQGAVIDSQVPNNITIDLATVASDVTCTNCLTNTEVASADLATNVSDADFGDVTVASGAWAVEDDSHAHGASTLNTDSVSADELNATGVEAELEAVLDLQELQGAVTDGQVPNTITIDLATTATAANAGDSATAFFSSGQIEAARGGTGIDSSSSTGIARVLSGTWSVSELSGDVKTIGSNVASIPIGSVAYDEIGDPSRIDGINFASFTNVWTSSVGNANFFTIDGSADVIVQGDGDTTIGGDLTVTGDDIFMTTNTSGAVLVGDGTNYNPVVMSADASIATNGAVAVADDSHAHTSSTISGIDISADTNLTAGRSLTLSSDDVLADAELYTDEKCVYILNPVATNDLFSMWSAPVAASITGINCESDQTVNMDLQVDDGSATGVNGSDIACTSTWAEDTSLAGDTTMAANDHLDLAITSVSGTPTRVAICWKFTYDD